MNKHFMSAAKKASAAVAVMVLCGMGAGVVNAAEFSYKSETQATAGLNIKRAGYFHDSQNHYAENCDNAEKYYATAGAFAKIGAEYFANDQILANKIGDFKDLNADIKASTQYQGSYQDSTDANSGTVVGALNATYGALNSKIGNVNTSLNNKANTSLDNLTEAGKLAAKKLAQEAIEVKGEGAVEVTTSTVQDGSKTTYTVKVNGNGAVAANDTGLVTGDTVYKALKNNVGEVNADGTYKDFAGTDLANYTNMTGAVNAVNNKVGDGKYTSVNYVSLGQSATAAISTLDANLKKTDNKVGATDENGKFTDFAGDNLLADKTSASSAIKAVSGKVGVTDANGKFTAFAGSDLADKENVADAVNTVNGKVGATDADGKFTDFKGDNLLADKKTTSSAIKAVSGKMGATEADGKFSDFKGNSLLADATSVTGAVNTLSNKMGTVGTDGKFSDFAGSDIADAASVTGAVKAVNDKVGDTQYASTKYVSAGTSATEAIGALDKGLSDLDGKIGKVGAGAAALAALHPLDYDADDKFSFAAGYGNYAGENAAALGAFYRPNENVMFSVGGTLGTGENMVNAGVSFALGHGAAAGTSKAAMAKKIEAQDEEIADLKAEVEELKAMVRELAAK